MIVSILIYGNGHYYSSGKVSNHIAQQSLTLAALCKFRQKRSRGTQSSLEICHFSRDTSVPIDQAFASSVSERLIMSSYLYYTLSVWEFEAFTKAALAHIATLKRKSLSHFRQMCESRHTARLGISEFRAIDERWDRVHRYNARCTAPLYPSALPVCAWCLRGTFMWIICVCACMCSPMCAWRSVWRCLSTSLAVCNLEPVCSCIFPPSSLCWLP